MPAARVRERSCSMCASIFVRYSVLHVLRNHLDPLLRLEIDEDGGLRADLRPNLLRIEHVKQHHLIAVKAQRLNGAHDRLRDLVEIRDHDRRCRADAEDS